MTGSILNLIYNGSIQLRNNLYKIMFLLYYM